MSRPVARYRPSPRFYFLALFALFGAALSAWCGMRWPAAWAAAGGFAISAAALLVLVLRPVVEIHETHLKIGSRAIPWRDIRRVDRTAWNAPLVVRLAFRAPGGERRLTLVYPGDLSSCNSLLRHLKRYSREALLDGIPHGEFWAESPSRRRQLPPGKQQSQLPAPRYQLLTPEDEEEVERMFQRLKSEGSLEQRGSGLEQRGSGLEQRGSGSAPRAPDKAQRGPAQQAPSGQQHEEK